MAILIACEESQRICNAFRERGHKAFSCDIQEPSGGHPEWHIQGDVLRILNPTQISKSFYGIVFQTLDGIAHKIEGSWDLIIAHPPCTFLTVAANRWYNIERYGDKAIERIAEREKATEFFMRFVNADCEHIAVENPVGHMNTHYRKPDQAIQPYQFGHPVSKKTCLWLKNLPLLHPTNIVEYEKIHSNGKSGGYSGNSWYAKDANGKALRWSDPETAKQRSKTYPGVAEAIADQWGEYLMSCEGYVRGE